MWGGWPEASERRVLADSRRAKVQPPWTRRPVKWQLPTSLSESVLILEGSACSQARKMHHAPKERGNKTPLPFSLIPRSLSVDAVHSRPDSSFVS